MAALACAIDPFPFFRRINFQLPLFSGYKVDKGENHQTQLRFFDFFQIYAFFSGFIRRWVAVGRKAGGLNTGAAASSLIFDQQYRHWGKESVYCSLLNLFTYPWIEGKARKGLLSVHGGYHDFVQCTFEKWTLDYSGGKTYESNRVAVKNQSFWRRILLSVLALTFLFVVFSSAA